MTRLNWPASYAALKGAKLWCRLSEKDRMRFYKGTWTQRKNRKANGRKKLCKKTYKKKT